MRLMLRGLVNQTWEDVAPEVTMSTVGNTYVLGQVVTQFTMTC